MKLFVNIYLYVFILRMFVYSLFRFVSIN